MIIVRIPPQFIPEFDVSVKGHISGHVFTTSTPVTFRLKPTSAYW